MNIGEKLQKFEKKIQDLIFGHARDPLKIRQVIIEEIEGHIEPVGRSKHIFPFNHLHVRLLATSPEQRAIFEAVIINGETLKRQTLECLRKAGCDHLEELVVIAEIVDERGPEWDKDSYFHISYELRSQTKRAASPQSRAGKKPLSLKAQLIVLNGKATKKRYRLTKSSINIGRLPEILDRDHHVVRRNDVVFTDGTDEVNQTVSRIHARIQYDEEAGEFRIHDEQSEQGTRIFRNSTSISVISGSRRGSKLQPGDEICFGLARVRYEIKK